MKTPQFTLRILQFARTLGKAQAPFRTRRAALTAPGAPRVLPAGQLDAAGAQGVGMVLPR
jgi:hypothetical protein